MSQALFVSQLANRVNSLGKLDAKNGLFNWPLDDLAQEILPAGTILIWSGVVADIPKGWQLCDGTNGTPDLRARFVMGGGGSINVGTTGGNLNFTLSLTESNLPAHTHSLSGLTSDTAGSHSHTISDPGHAHTQYSEYFNLASVDSALSLMSRGLPQPPAGRNSGPAVNASSTNITINTSGGHTHTFPGATTSSVGSGASVAIPTTPPYYALCYIMRLPYSGSNSLEYGPPAPGLGGNGSGIDSWTVETATGGLLLRITAEDLTFKDIKLAAGNNIELVRTNAGELTINSTANFDFEGSWSAKKTTDLPEASPARYWTPTREATLNTYIDENDYLNFFPTAGVLKENKVPVYADFAFSIQAQGLFSFWLTDNQNFDVAYFHVNSPEGRVRVYKAYRFTFTTDFFYDTEPLVVNFATADEYVMCMYNVGTNFAYVILGNNATPAARKYWIARTNASSKSREWQAVADVTSLVESNYNYHLSIGTNFFYMTDPAGDRILRLRQDKYTAANFTLDVYDNALNLLRSLNLVVDADYDKTGRFIVTGQATDGWNTQTYNGHQYNWNTYFNWISRPPVFAPAFTWNKYTEELLFVFNGYYIKAGTPNVEQGATMTVSWQIPRTWLLSGTGTPSNNITDKGGGKRYKIVPDGTWDTDTGGMSTHYQPGWGWVSSVVTDEYAQRITMTRVSHWSTTDFAAVEFNNVVLKTLGTNAIAKQKSSTPKVTLIPDASEWSKITYSYLFHVIGNNISIASYSNSSGWKNVTVDFFTNKFESRPIGDSLGLNNTLYVDPTTAKNIPNYGPTGAAIYDGSFYSTTVIAGVPHYYRIKVGSPVEKITLTSGASGNTRVFSPLPGGAFTLPAIPTTIGGVTEITNEINSNLFGQIVYNGNDSNKVFWAVVKGKGGMTSPQFYIAKYSSGSWGNIYGPFAQAQADDSNALWGDTGNRLYTDRGCGLLTENGKFLFQFWYLIPGGGKFYVMRYNTVTNTPEIKGIHGGLGMTDAWDPEIFKHTANNRYQSMQGVNGYYGNSFGYSTELGYYCAGGMSNQISIAILSTKDVRGSNTTVFTEDEWWNDRTKCHEINFTAEPTVGLFAYVRNFPLFVGGYYGFMPNQVVAVPANKTSWVYAIKPDALADRRNITVQVSDEYQPSSFRKVNLASITTVTDKIIASEGFDTNPDTWEPPEGLNVNRTFTFTGRKATGNNGTFNLCVVRGLTVNSTLEIAINFAASGNSDKGSYQKGVFAVGTYVNSSTTGLYVLEASAPVNRTVTGTPFTYTRTGPESLVISWNGAGLSSTDTNFALYLRINTNLFLTINRLDLDA